MWLRILAAYLFIGLVLGIRDLFGSRTVSVGQRDGSFKKVPINPLRRLLFWEYWVAMATGILLWLPVKALDGLLDLLIAAFRPSHSPSQS